MSDLQDVECLMDQMLHALIHAKFQDLQMLSPQLETALAALPAQLDRAVLQRLRRKADRNAACALASGRGVRAALRRLEEIRQAATGLTTYDAKGQRTGRDGPAGLSRRF